MVSAEKERHQVDHHTQKMLSLRATAERERDTNIQNPVVSPISEGCQIRLNTAEILFTPALHKVHLPFSIQPSYFLHQPASSMSTLACPMYL